MAITIPGHSERVVTIEEYLDYVSTQVDLLDLDSVADSAPLLRGLAQDRELVVRRINEQVLGLFRHNAAASAQVVFLGEGDGFYVRANIWPSTADIASGRIYQDQFSYHLFHDHNYHFMTVGYSGPGYLTDIYEYDHDRLTGEIGEKVDFRHLESVHFTAGMVMLYRRSRDAHIQYPPDDLSISLNLMIASPGDRLRDQYFFDIETRTLAEHSQQMEGSHRVSIIELAGHAGNEDTCEALQDLAARHPCRRSRLSSFQSLERLLPGESERLWRLAARDREPLVANFARRRLDALSAG